MNVQVYKSNGTVSQRFMLTSLGNGYYKITAMVSNKVLDVSGGCKNERTNVWQYTYNGTSAQQWMLQNAGDGYYYIVPRLNTNLCLEVVKGNYAGGTNVWVNTRLTTVFNYSQKWKLT